MLRGIHLCGLASLTDDLFSLCFLSYRCEQKGFCVLPESDNSFVILSAELKKALKTFIVGLHVYMHLTYDINAIYVGAAFSPNVPDWRTLTYEVHREEFTKP
uniref:Uncharacterized protein n=1 Tax=Theropithecus gelada TaxID=9565 RepID=A0A8D2JWB5_THEGE